MEATLKNLPLGIQTFEDIRRGDYLYVDKTRYILQMLTKGKPYFLSRPRRFGKSLLVSTLKAVFLGKKELFEGLYIYDKWDFAQVHPIIHLDWSGVTHSTAALAEQNMLLYLKRDSDSAGLKLTSACAADIFGEYIQKLYEKTGKQVVVLIDEYDNPITDALGNNALIDEMRTFLQTFYKQLKANDAYIRFIFITGVSKFAKMSLFSALNNPTDMSFKDEYAAICGYTQEELETHFADYIERMAPKYNYSKDEMINALKRWYDGYSWDSRTFVYNPVTTMTAFDRNEIGNYWFATATPYFLVKALRDNDELDNVMKPVVADDTHLDIFTPENLGTVALLFQTGYLTIKSKYLEGEYTKYVLEMPNEEVCHSLIKFLSIGYSHLDFSYGMGLSFKMQAAISEQAADKIASYMQTMIQNIPNLLHIGNERYYHSLFILWMLTLGFKIEGEILTANGRIDAVLEQQDKIIVCELKYDPQKPKKNLLREAMKQISSRRYYEKYQNRDKKIVLLGLSFTGKDKTVGCEITNL